MKKILPVIFMAVTAGLLCGCELFVTVEPTTIRVRNNMYGLEIDDANQEVTGIDLFDVQVGDILWEEILARETTISVNTETRGNTYITIDYAEATVITYIGLVGFEDVIPFADIDLMSAYIEDGEANTVILDEIVAEAILNSPSQI
jgi:hypothetical protein